VGGSDGLPLFQFDWCAVILPRKVAKMMKRKLTSVPAVDDPTVETTEIVIGGKTYKMCFDFRSLAKAERELNAAGHKISLLTALPGHNLESIYVMFAASIRRFHPEIAYEDAIDLVDLPTAFSVYSAIVEAWAKAMPEPRREDKRNPTEPGR
jgi:hypothetical protein